MYIALKLINLNFKQIMSCYRCDKNKKYNITLTRESFNLFDKAFFYIKNPNKNEEIIEIVKMKLEKYIAEGLGKCTCFIRKKIENSM